MLDRGRYEVKAAIGAGAFGTVYRTRFIGTGGFTRRVALKVLSGRLADMDDVAGRLRDEARVMGLLRHRAIAQVERLTHVDGRWALLMEYVEGVGLDELVPGTMPVGPALEIVGEVAAALHAAFHAPGPDGAPLRVLHRDIKPGNIMLTHHGELKVLDFGAARADFRSRESETRGFMLGSMTYMAPERLDMEDSAAADVYALGAVFFELVVGRGFGNASGDPVRHKKRVSEALRVFWEKTPERDRELVAFVGSMLAYEPEDRPSAWEVEERCALLRGHSRSERLRAWAARAVPAALASRAVVKHDELAGSILWELPDGSLGAALSAHPDPDISVVGASPPELPPVQAAPDLPAPPAAPQPASPPEMRPEARPSSAGLLRALVLMMTTLVAGLVLGIVLAVSLSSRRPHAEQAPAQPPDLSGLMAAQPEEEGPVQPATEEPDSADAPAAQPLPSAPVATQNGSGGQQLPVAAQDGARGVRVELKGGAEQVWLVSRSGKALLPATLVPGSYAIHALFPGKEEPFAVGRAVLQAGSSPTVVCNKSFMRCVVQ